MDLTRVELLEMLQQERQARLKAEEVAAEERSKRQRVETEMSELKRTVDLKRYQSLSLVHVLRNFQDKNPRKSLLTHLKEKHSLKISIQGLWEKYFDFASPRKHKTMLDPFLDLLKIPTSNKEAPYQEFMDEIIPKLLDDLSSKLCYFPKETLFNPKKTPDATLVGRNVAKATWETMVLVLEFKPALNTLKDQGMGQALSYASLGLQSQIPLNRKKIYGAFSDCHTISFFLLGEDDFYTQNMPLFNQDKVATEGFHSLCMLLSLDLGDLGYCEPPSSIVINDEQYNHVQFIGAGAECKVFQCKYKDQDTIVKLPRYETINNFLLLRKEAENIKLLRNTSTLLEFIPQLIGSFPNALVLAPVGTLFEKAILESENPNHCIRKYFDQLLSSVQKLHEAKFVHNDLRLENIVICQDHVLLIDWQSLSRVGERLETYRTAFPLIPDRMIESLLAPIPEMLETSVYDDLEQIAYGLIYLIHGSYPWMYEVEKALKQIKLGQKSYQLLLSQRTQFIDNLDSESVEKQFLYCLYNSCRSNKLPDYQELKNIIQRL